LNGTTHAVFGVAALAGAALLAGADPPAYVYPAPVLHVLGRPVSWALRTTSFVLVRTVGHRTLTHSVLGALIFALPIYLFLGEYPNLSLALVAGYASHVFADALNTRGVPLLWPLGRPFRLIPGGIKSGGAIEVAVALGALMVALYAILELNPPLRTILGFL
jgi:inner membrane protein